VSDVSFDGRFKKFFDVWSSFRQPGQVLPTWANVKPMAFGGLLPDVVLVKRHGAKDFRFRLMGSEVNERLGSDPVGEQAFRLLDARHHEAIYTWFDAIVAQPCGAMHEMSVEFEKASPKRAKALNLPIRGNEGEVDTFMYLYSFWQPEPGENPGRVLSAGRTYFKLQAIDIGAGVPDNLPTF